EGSGSLHRAAIWGKRAGQYVQEGGLAASVLADDCNARSGSDHEVDLSEHRGDTASQGDIGDNELRSMARGMGLGNGEHSNPSIRRTTGRDLGTQNDGDPEGSEQAAAAGLGVTQRAR